MCEVDTATFSDLNFFGGGAGRASVLEAVDFCQTRMGSAALRRRLARPECDPQSIRDAQDAVSYAMRCGWDLSDIARPLAGVHRYLETKIEAIDTRNPIRSFFESWWIWLRYTDVYTDLRQCLVVLRDFLVVADRVAQRLCSATSKLLVDLGDTASRCLASEPLAALLRDVSMASWPHVVMRRDSGTRGQGATDLVTLLEVFAEVDAIWSMAEATARHGFVMPSIADTGRFEVEAESLVHPLVPSSVGNSVSLFGEHRALFLTGPNMSGKSTYVRAVCIAVLLAQSGMGVPASRFWLSPAEVVLTSLNPVDDVEHGISSFLAEVHRVRTAAQALADRRRAFVVFDELFRSTNVRDALEAARAVITGFAASPFGGCIFASHLTELARELEQHPHVQLACFDGQVESGQVSYDYAVQPGSSDTRLGLPILKQEGIVELIERIP